MKKSRWRSLIASIALVLAACGGVAVASPATAAVPSCEIYCSNLPSTQQGLAAEIIARGAKPDASNPGLVTAELQPIAEGRTIQPQCTIDTRILQLLVVVERAFGGATISDISRPCIGDNTNCPTSGHCQQPAQAVDLTALDGSPLTAGGANTPLDLDFLHFIDQFMPSNTWVEQQQCRPAQSWLHLHDFAQTPCNHQHVDVQHTAGQLAVTTSGSALPGGTLVQVTGSSAGGWQSAPLPIQTQSGNITSTYVGGGWPQIWENYQGNLFETWGDSNGWHRMQVPGLPTFAADASISAITIPGNGNAVVYVNSGGRIYEVRGDNAGWHYGDTGITVGANAQIAAVWENGGWGEIWVNDGGAIYEVWVNGGAWTKLPSGITVQADAKLAPVVVNGTLHIFIQSAGQLYLMYAGNGWQIAPINVPNIGRVSIAAAYTGGSDATVMVNNAAGTSTIGTVYVGDNGWTLGFTGQSGSAGVITAVNTKPGVTTDNFPYTMVVR